MYKIKDISNLTGVKTATIRIWEKRYNLIEPKRTDTNIRYYNDEDLVKLLNVTSLIQNNWKISKIAKLSNEQLKSEVENLSKNIKNSSFLTLLVKSLTTIDEALFNETINMAVKKEGMKKSYLELIIPFFQKVGIMWQAGSISPIQEHFVSNLVRQKLIVAIDQLPTPDKNKPIDIILYCRENEFHELSLLFYNYCLIKNKLKTLYLGQNVPTNDLIKITSLIQPDFGLVTSVINSSDKDRLERYFSNINKKTNCAIYVGGSALPKNLISKLSFVKQVEELI